MLNQIEVLRMFLINKSPTLKAFATIRIGPFVFKGLKVINGSSGLFVSYPSEKGKSEGEYFPIIIVEDETVKDAINGAVLEAYENKVKNPFQD